MLPTEILALYDREMRRDLVPAAGSHVERVGPIVRVVGNENTVLWSDLNEADAEGVVEEQAGFFRSAGGEFE